MHSRLSSFNSFVVYNFNYNICSGRASSLPLISFLFCIHFGLCAKNPSVVLRSSFVSRESNQFSSRCLFTGHPRECSVWCRLQTRRCVLVHTGWGGVYARSHCEVSKRLWSRLLEPSNSCECICNTVH